MADSATAQDAGISEPTQTMASARGESAREEVRREALIRTPNSSLRRDKDSGTSMLDRNLVFHVPASELWAALAAWSQQSGVQYAIWDAQLESVQTPPVVGLYSARAALRMILANTTLTARVVSGVIYLEDLNDTENHRVVRNDNQIVVKGSKPGVTSMDADIPLEQDHTRPYVGLTRDEIEHAGDVSLDKLIARHLPSVRSGSTREQPGGIGARTTQFRVRNLSVSETLVLINGRRMSSSFTNVIPAQTDLSAIPASAVERIEVLPATAAGIYGGGANAVINVELRRNYVGSQVAATFGQSFASDADSRRILASHSGSYNDDRTRLRVTANLSDTSALLVGDRDYVERARASMLARTGSASPGGKVPLGAQPNFRSTSGKGLCGEGSPGFGTLTSGGSPSSCSASSGFELGEYDLQLADTSQVDARAHTLINGPATRYVNASLTHQFEHALAYLDATHSLNSMRNHANGADGSGSDTVFVPGPLNIFNQDLLVRVARPEADGIAESKLTSRVLTAGVVFSLSDSWRLGAEYTDALGRARWSQPLASADPRALFAGVLSPLMKSAVATGASAEGVGTLFTSPLDSRNRVASLRLAGTVLGLNAGPVSVALLAERREEKFSGGEEFTWARDRSPTEAGRLTNSDRVIESAYMEWHVPLLQPLRYADESGEDIACRSPQLRAVLQSLDLFERAAPYEWQAAGRATRECRRPSVVEKPRLELQIAGRIDRYVANVAVPRVDPMAAAPVDRARTSFTERSPVLGVLYRLSRTITLRSSVTQVFIPPTREQSAPGVTRIIPAGKIQDPRRGGQPTANDVLLMAGGNPSVRPEKSRSWSAGLVFGSDEPLGWQLSLDYTRIKKTDAIASLGDLALNVREFEARVPKQARREDPGSDPAYGVGELVALDARDRNLAKMWIQALDASLLYSAYLEQGRLDFLARATWQPVLERQETPDSPVQNDAGMAEQGSRFGGFAELAFTRNNWSAGWNVSMHGRYAVGRSEEMIQAQGSRYVPRQLRHDVWVGLDVPLENSVMSSLGLQLTVENVFNRRAAQDVAAPGYMSPFGDARRGMIWLSVQANFKR